MDRVKYTRILSDSEGESHFEEVEVDLKLVDFAPPAPAVYVSAYEPAARIGFVSAPPNWYGDWHPTPRRQFFFYTEGESEVEASDGEVRRVGPGSILLAEDTTGRGHRSRAVGAAEVVAVSVQLPD